MILNEGNVCRHFEEEKKSVCERKDLRWEMRATVCWVSIFVCFHVPIIVLHYFDIYTNEDIGVRNIYPR